jgi:hypothetical protein
MQNKLWKEWHKNVVLAAFLLVNTRWKVKLKSVKPWKKNDKKNMKTKRRVNLYFCGFQNRDKGAPESWSLPQEKTTIFHEFNTNEPDFIASTGWMDLWKNVTMCGSSPSGKIKYRQIQYHFWNLQKKFSVLCKMKVHHIQTSNIDKTDWTAKCFHPTMASHEEKSARRYVRSKELAPALLFHRYPYCNWFYWDIKKSCLKKYSYNSTSWYEQWPKMCVDRLIWKAQLLSLNCPVSITFFKNTKSWKEIQS